MPMDVINKIAAMSPPTSKTLTQAFLGFAGFWRIYISRFQSNCKPSLSNDLEE